MTDTETFDPPVQDALKADLDPLDQETYPDFETWWIWYCGTAEYQGASEREDCQVAFEAGHAEASRHLPVPHPEESALLQALEERDQMISELRVRVQDLEQTNTAVLTDCEQKQQVLWRLEDEAKAGGRYLENLERALRILDRVTE